MDAAREAAAEPLRFSVNGRPVEIDVPGGARLLDVLRLELGLVGTKEGCGEGECGACSVLLDGEAVNSCLLPACQVRGRAVVTVEGLGEDTSPDPLQEAFVEAGGVQCGICTPGMLMAARAFIGSGTPVTDASVREAIAGNLCRCTGYTRIIEAIRRAAEAPVGPVPDGPTLPPVPSLPSFPLDGGPEERARPDATRWHRTIDHSLAGPETRTPRSLVEAVDLLSSGAGRPIAGGTDVMVGLAARNASRDDSLIDLWGVDELRGIDREGDELVLGALTTYRDLRRSSLVGAVLPVLAQLGASVGAIQIQNRGTLGGNIATASPAGDSLPLLLATDAIIEVVGPRGRRRVAASDFWPAYRRTALAPDELVAAVRIPIRRGREVRFRKVAGRRAQAISKVSLALAWRRDGRAWRDVRIALGSVAPTPIRARGAEAALEGSVPTLELADRAATTLASEITPIDDVRSTAAYRRAVAGRVLWRMILDATAPES